MIRVSTSQEIDHERVYIYDEYPEANSFSVQSGNLYIFNVMKRVAVYPPGQWIKAVKE